MRALGPILTAHLFAPLNDELVVLLRGLSAEEWSAPTAAGSWTVKDVAAHLLDTSMRRVAALRDEWHPPLPPGAFSDGVGPFVDRLNRDWIGVATRLSPRMLIEMHELYGPALAAAMGAIDPFAKAPLAVSWAGEEESPGWFDVARELTEKWHHQQQIRDATGRSPLYEGYLAPVIDTFARALPFAYRDVAAAEETAGSDDLIGILLDMRQSETIERSSALAEEIIGAFRADGEVPVRGVKQAGFQVLKSVVVPSVLVEVGFVTNSGEAKRLLKPEYRERLAEGMANGIASFLATETGMRATR